jgi:hypothetical protein
MNKINVFFWLLLSFFVIFDTQAATSGPEWNQMEIRAVYEKGTQEMKISALLEGVTRISSTNYTIDFNLNGKLFQQRLQYNSVNDTLSANFVNFTKTLATSYPVSYTIKGSNANTLRIHWNTFF